MARGDAGAAGHRTNLPLDAPEVKAGNRHRAGVAPCAVSCSTGYPPACPTRRASPVRPRCALSSLLPASAAAQRPPFRDFSRYYPDYSGTTVGSKPEQIVFKMFWARVGWGICAGRTTSWVKSCTRSRRRARRGRWKGERGCRRRSRAAACQVMTTGHLVANTAVRRRIPGALVQYWTVGCLPYASTAAGSKVVCTLAR